MFDKITCFPRLPWLLGLVLSFCFWGATPAESGSLITEVIAYPYPREIEASTDYQLNAADKNILVHKTPVASIVAFAFLGEVEVVVDVKRTVKRAVVRPLSLGITPTVQGDTLHFRISKPCYLAVEVDDDLHRPLFIFADAPDKSPPKAGDPNVRFFEGGKIHEAGVIELKSNETLYLAPGAVVRGVVRAKKASGIRILGPGILDASTFNKQLKLVHLIECKNVEINGPTLLGSYGWTIVPYLTEDFHMQNVKVVSWRDNDDGFDPDSSRRVTADHCFFRTKDDCIAIKAHGELGKSNPSSKEAPDYFNTEDIKISRCTFWSSEWGHAMTVGFAVSAPLIRNITFEDCDIIKKEKGPAMSIDNHDLGTVENVLFDNIRVEDGCDKLFAAKVAFSEYSVDCPLEYFRNNEKRLPADGEGWKKVILEKRSEPRGRIKNVTLRNIQIQGDLLLEMEVKGFSSQNEISDVLFKNISFRGVPLHSTAEAGVRIKSATNVRVEL